eukprot:2809684-Lingulodinium_polyedra.AAC.1
MSGGPAGRGAFFGMRFASIRSGSSAGGGSFRGMAAFSGLATGPPAPAMASPFRRHGMPVPRYAD